MLKPVEINNKLSDVVHAIHDIVRDKKDQIELALAAFLSGGHVLIEDTPGTGKTSLAQAFGHHLNLDWKRLQCTNDTMPSDIIGVNVFDPQSGNFTFRQGPLFTELMLVDELNRAPSKSQSALLEAMAEGQASIDGRRYALPTPFLLIATQNPAEQIGVSPLPESQLDRFAVSFTLGLPSTQTEAKIIADADSRFTTEVNSTPVLPERGFLELCDQRKNVICDAKIVTYLQDIATAVRGALLPHLSVRALIQIKGLAQAHALINGRDYVAPEDIQLMVPSALRHRFGQNLGKTDAMDKLQDMLTSIAVP
ncbi:hypothetical protein IMCC14465_03590 [alpha proteobacterium IMCC14465]|uniref:MoxR-like ATPase n=1 Tax=alpha proteobacterium IMCC14465 TaxID=1220535 RepID=J9A6F7_9PROT|nr:hypothetical protein IMCC14465_03590 [alpha proteobacterium IMCC14465]